MENKEQETMFKLQMFDQHIQQIQKQLEAIERGIFEMNELNMGLDDLVNSEGKEIFAPIGRGIFARAKLLSEELHVDIGEGNIVKKTIPETKEIISNQIKKLEDAKKELERAFEESNKELMKLVAEAQKQHAVGHPHECKNCSDEDCTCDEEGNCGCRH